ncbi:MAG TPA: MFS transporter [Acidobacteriaceae bacterium]|nr:MFS transporter [Acidobacteriaceae bacterium]
MTLPAGQPRSKPPEAEALIGVLPGTELPLGSGSPAWTAPRAGLGPFSRVAAVFLCGVLAFLDLYATQPLLPLLQRIFHAGKGAVGLTVSASTLGVAISAPLLGLFAERLSRKRVIVSSIVVLAAPTLLAATSPNLPIFIAWRLLQGILMPGIFGVTIAYITEEWAADSVVLAMSIYVSGTALGGSLGRILTGVLTSWLNWRWAFVLLGILNLCGSFAVARLLPREARPSSARHAGATSLRSFFRPMAAHLRNPRLIATYFIGFNILFSLVGVFTYVTFYLAAPPFLLSTRALSYVFVVYLAGLVATPAAGAILPRIGLRAGLAMANGLSLVGVLATLVPRLPAVAFGLALCCTGVFISQACGTSYVREATPGGGRVSAVGLYIAFYYVGGTAGGVIPSYLWHWGGWPGCAVFIAALDLLTIGIALLGWRDIKPSVPAAQPSLSAARVAKL